MDGFPTREDWIRFIEILPAGIEILRLDEADTDGFFEIETWAPNEASPLAKFLTKFPAGTTIEKIVNEVDDELCMKLWIPKPDPKGEG